MDVFRISIPKITGNDKLSVGIYKPVGLAGDHPYGILDQWEFLGAYPAWYSDASASEYGGDGGIRADTTRTIYVQAFSLPPRIGAQIGENGKIRPSISVENFYDFDGVYAYTVVIV